MEGQGVHRFRDENTYVVHVCPSNPEEHFCPRYIPWFVDLVIFPEISVAKMRSCIGPTLTAGQLQLMRNCSLRFHIFCIALLKIRPSAISKEQEKSSRALLQCWWGSSWGETYWTHADQHTMPNGPSTDYGPRSIHCVILQLAILALFQYVSEKLIVKSSLRIHG
jgi:hypothetical protein